MSNKNETNNSQKSNENTNMQNTLKDNLIKSLKLNLSVVLGKKEMLIQDILNFTSGEVIPLDRKVSEPIDLYVGNVLVAKGTLVSSEDGIGVKINELVNPIS